MIPRSLCYKLIHDNRVIAEGSKKDMKKLKRKLGLSRGFVIVGSPQSTIGQLYKTP